MVVPSLQARDKSDRIWAVPRLLMAACGHLADVPGASSDVSYGCARSTGQCNTACSLSAGVWKPKVFRGR